MLEPMYVRCAQCGYDNSPEYRFCGMCGGALPHPAKETPQPERDVLLPPVAAPIPPQARVSPFGSSSDQSEKVHGPSFLGLSDDPGENFDYPDDDEPKRSRTALIAVLVLLIAAAGFLGWQWRHDGFPFNRITAGSAPEPSASPTGTASDAPQSPETQAADKPTTARGAPSSPADSGAQTDSSGKDAEQRTQEATAASPSASTSPDQTAPEDKAASAEASPTASIPVRPRVKKPDPAKTQTQSPGVETAALPTSPDTGLEIAGERYLYGTGVPENCTRAESSLRTAATHGNPKAETVLGTMYATGHCVGRDLPTAYRWFAHALHQDPQNSRISADLQVLWRQMTPEEKQLATTSGK